VAKGHFLHCTSGARLKRTHPKGIPHDTTFFQWRINWAISCEYCRLILITSQHAGIQYIYYGGICETPALLILHFPFCSHAHVFFVIPQ